MENPNGEKSDGTVIELLRQALTNKDVLHEPWTSGVVNLSKPEASLFYQRQGGTPRFLTLGSNTVLQVEDLNSACQPATFGLNQKDVLDETYRKAGKIDAGNFLWGFNPDTGNFASELASGLFPWGSLDKGIRFELYKLNVYGEGSFFKAHQDTPRGEDMFGSLVFLLPFEHEGGNLLLRHSGREHDFDGLALLKGSPPASIAYIAFFSDVEHEVTQVKSGYRATITYNLYFDSKKGVPVTQVPSDAAQLEHPFKTTLSKCLHDAATQPVPRYLGFGLAHAYAFNSVVSKSVNLKGSDATLVKTLSELKIVHYFFMLYRETKENDQCPLRVLSMATIDGHIEEDGGYDESVFEVIAAGKGSFLVWDQDPEEVAKDPPYSSDWYDCYADNKRRYKPMDLKWITEPSEEYLDRSTVIAYGNEASLGHYYHQLCVVAIIPQAEGQAAPVGAKVLGDDAMEREEGDENEGEDEDEDEDEEYE